MSLNIAWRACGLSMKKCVQNVLIMEYIEILHICSEVKSRIFRASTFLQFWQPFLFFKAALENCANKICYFFGGENNWGNKMVILPTTLNNLNFIEQSIKKRSKFDNWTFRVNVKLEQWLLCWESSTLLKTIILRISTLVFNLTITICRVCRYAQFNV